MEGTISEAKFGVIKIWGQTPRGPLVNDMTFAYSMCSMPQFPHLKSRDTDSDLVNLL